MGRLIIVALSVTVGAGAALAQTPPPAAAPKSAAAVSSAPPIKAVAAKKPERCMRLPLSDVAFGKEASIAAARVKLDEYAAAEAKRRGWPNAPLIKSNEAVGDCSVYLDFGPLIGTEYRCLVTATFCQK
jgi:hypothetical protein